jgi:hypothetical protein
MSNPHQMILTNMQRWLPEWQMQETVEFGLKIAMIHSVNVIQQGAGGQRSLCLELTIFSFQSFTLCNFKVGSVAQHPQPLVHTSNVQRN